MSIAAVLAQLGFQPVTARIWRICTAATECRFSNYGHDPDRTRLKNDTVNASAHSTIMQRA